MHPAGGDLDEQEHIETTKEDFIDGYEVAGDDALGLGGKELLPRGSRPSGGGVDPLALEDGPHRGRSDFDAKLFELALDARVTRSRSPWRDGRRAGGSPPPFPGDPVGADRSSDAPRGCGASAERSRGARARRYRAFSEARRRWRQAGRGPAA